VKPKDSSGLKTSRQKHLQTLEAILGSYNKAIKVAEEIMAVVPSMDQTYLVKFKERLRVACRTFQANRDKVKLRRGHKFSIFLRSLEELKEELADPMVVYSKEMALQTRNFWQHTPADKFAKHRFWMWKRDHPKPRLSEANLRLAKRIKGDSQ
jgi:hypothetical protein